jgi:hypothetical protein
LGHVLAGLAELGERGQRVVDQPGQHRRVDPPTPHKRHGETKLPYACLEHRAPPTVLNACAYPWIAVSGQEAPAHAANSTADREPTT